mmetsp:Transcript_86180/g.239886  ORF Transcript_86180/g.239886 Transcript_86180/m.239886 type:complete len:428 (+) Transcript_86180:146-1429(+)|eukprot:CAMPEP_0176196394 /NCGR_PEP_ID=MMETSP0121_2-20121125/7004_1 /TAXON_ID=160619 /ORGANISM="Kryptoperidinium foliaceum, Strain CCMP 1326" /LENGTH=427 /DNA_ID=CAMNT_0017535191 /DNA_START=177 /DNA_END=1460 /DNA_ORIENTATION=-
MTGEGGNHTDDGSSSSTDNTTQKKIGEYPQSYLLEKAKEIVADRTKDWEITDTKAEDRIPRFHRDEIEIAGELGKGGFFVVSEVKRITLRHDEEGDDGASHEESSSRHLEDEDYIQAVVQNRKFMARHCLRNGKDPRYAFKTMQEENLKDPDTFLNSVVDMVMEFKFLSSVRHPNIIKMRAVSAGDLYYPSTFILLDKIYDTLDTRIDKWKKKEDSAFNKLFDFQKKREKNFMAKRLLVAFDIASALAYLHDMNIMYRDLKPSNVGFDVRNDPKLFDFGLATEFRPEELDNGTYKLTGDTGTIRYMAPEVALSHPYTEKADVYSFGILLWQICQMEMPYEKLSDGAIERKVIQLGYRPKIDPQWPASLRRLLQDCFASSPRRPAMQVVCDVLRHEIKQLSDKDMVDDEDFIESARSARSARYITPYN